MTNHNKLTMLFSKDWFKILLLVLMWHIVLAGIGIVSERIIGPTRGYDPSAYTLTSHTFRWDSGWYGTITREFYQDSGPGHEVFYPLFPLVTVIIQKMSLGLLTTVEAGLVVNVIASFFACLALFRITMHHYKQKKYAWLSVLSFLSFPTAFFMHMFYTEALFCALAFWSYYFALKKRWASMAIILALLTATRITSILFIGLCGLEYLRSIGWSLRKLDKNILWFSLAPVGFLAYGTYLRAINGNFLSMFSAYDAVPDWQYQELNLNFVYTYAKSLNQSAHVLFGNSALDNGSFTNTVMPAIALTVLLTASIYAILKIKGWATPLGIFGIVSFIFFTLNSNVISAHRYVLPCIVVYLCGIHLTKSKTTLFYPYAVFLGLLALIQPLLIVLFTNGFFAG